MSEPFNTSLRRGASEPRDLIARVDAEVRDRIGEAVDFVCLESMVQSRSAAGLPAPAPDSVGDRAEFDQRVETFLSRLEEAMMAPLDAGQRQTLAGAGSVGDDRLSRLLAMQGALAKLLPDYWQRFEQVRAAHVAEPSAPAPPSGGDRPRWLDRLLGR